MIRFILVMVPAVFLINGFTKDNWLEALLFALAVAVGLTPEMLPMIVTMNLAKGAIAMSRKRVIVKRLNAIQNFGAMDVLCTDKTGTLTQDRIILKRHLDIHGEDSDRVLEYAYLNSHYQSGLKNLLDVAVLQHVELGKELHRGASVPAKSTRCRSTSSRRRMSVVLGREDGKHLLICKGAVEEVFAVCSRYEVDGESGAARPQPFGDARASKAPPLNADGFRVIAVAYKEINADRRRVHGRRRKRPDAARLHRLPRSAEGQRRDRRLQRSDAHGVRVKILTGDNEIVTRKICREVGLPVDAHRAGPRASSR